MSNRKIPDDELEALIRYFQADSDDLKVDGKWGKNTSAEIQAYIKANQHGGHANSERMREAFESALEDVGQCEKPLGSNMGPYVENLRKQTGLDRKAGGEWCAVFCSFHGSWANIPVKSRSALGYGRGIRDLPEGREVEKQELVPGFHGVVVRKRGRTGHHVQFFRIIKHWGAVQVEHVGGNENHRVKTATHTLADFFDHNVVMIVTVD